MFYSNCYLHRLKLENAFTYLVELLFHIKTRFRFTYLNVKVVLEMQSFWSVFYTWPLHTYNSEVLPVASSLSDRADLLCILGYPHFPFQPVAAVVAPIRPPALASDAKWSVAIIVNNCASILSISSVYAVCHAGFLQSRVTCEIFCIFSYNCLVS